jgi:hypothetical protein
MSDYYGVQYDEGVYCENCDESSPSEDLAIVPVDELHERYACPRCGYVHPKVCLTDYGFLLQEYLLSGSNWDEGVGLMIYQP